MLRKPNLRLTIALLAKALRVVVLGLLALFAYGVWAFVSADLRFDLSRARAATCVSNVAGLARAALKYAQDHGGRLPPAQEWCDLLRPYLKNAHAFVCPAAKNLRCSYAFNANLSGVRLDDIPESRHVVIFFESDRGWNAAGGPELLPAQPRHRFGEADMLVRGNRQGLGTSSSSSRYRLVETDQWQPRPQAAREATH